MAEEPDLVMSPTTARETDDLRRMLAPYLCAVSSRYHLIESSLARWLLDLDGHRYQSMEMAADPARAAVFGTWQEFSRIEVQPGGTILIQPAEGRQAVLRFRAVRARRAAAADSTGAKAPATR
ncbi:MAG: hypothetical protein M5T61_14550 [Acidimicrobiia bacterium]|nr:hypothetical protein [Acidimicrobiia bacterium]